MDVVRITELQPKTYVEQGDYIAIDNQSDGTKKVQFTNLLDDTLSQENKIAPANVVGDEIATIRAAVGSPLKASTVAQMTDTNKIYVYVGSESGYTNGNWYYWNGSAWVSGGVYNSVAVVTDPTLTLSGVPADAKATGDEVTNLRSDLEGTTRNINTAGVGRWRSINGTPYDMTGQAGEEKYFGMDKMIPCLPSTKYTATVYNISPITGTIQASYYDTNGNFISENHAGNISSLTFTTPATCAFVHIWDYLSAGFSISEQSKIQIELGAESTAYIQPFTAVDLVARGNIQELQSESARLKNIDSQLLFNSYIRKKPFAHHIGVSKVSDIIIPSQSLFDIQRAKRLGFEVIELNTLETSDGEYITNHGFSGKWGEQFYSTDSTDISNVAVSSMTLSEIKSKVRYNSIYSKYRVAPPTLEESLKECKRVGIVPLIQWHDGIGEIADAIMGKGNYIAGIYQSDRGNKTDSICSSWLTITDADELVAKCDASGGAYVACLNVSASAYSAFTETDWHNLAKAVHSAGYLIGCAYASAKMITVLQRAGFDLFISSFNINEIESGNLCNLFGENEFSDFSTTGIVADNAITLSATQTIVPAETLPSVFLGGGCLRIRFNGEIILYLGDYINDTYHFTSDGSETYNFTTFFENESPTFRVYAVQSTTVYEIDYKASAM